MDSCKWVDSCYSYAIFIVLQLVHYSQQESGFLGCIIKRKYWIYITAILPLSTQNKS